MAANKISKEEIILDSGKKAIASFPVIVSASRSTDIPAFYADWFFHRLEKGYSSYAGTGVCQCVRAGPTFRRG